MRKKTILLVGSVAALIIAVAGGCKNTDAQKGPERKATVVFSTAVPSSLPKFQAAPGGFGEVELINGAPAQVKNSVKRKKTLSVSGWVADPIEGTNPPAVVMQLNSAGSTTSYYAEVARTAQKRADIAKKMNNAAFENSAFQMDADIKALPRGDYLISFLQSNGKYIIGFDTNKHVIVE